MMYLKKNADSLKYFQTKTQSDGQANMTGIIFRKFIIRLKWFIPFYRFKSFYLLINATLIL